MTPNTLGTGSGAKIILGGVYTGSTTTEAAQFGAAKINATDGNFGFALQFSSRANAGSITEKMRIGSTGGVAVGVTTEPGDGVVQMKAQTFASLTACSGTLEGSMASVTDSSTATWGATITGSSTNHVLGYCNGTNWTVAGK
jgi:hypothetical protein